MPYGIKTAPQIFQRVMDEILRGVKGAVCYIDDILVTSASEEEHYAILEEVLKRLQTHNVHARVSKCSFFQESVEYLGHMVDHDGIHPLKRKVDALINLPEPTDVSELKAFMGMVNYYGKYISHLSTIVEPLNHLMRKGVPWQWTKECQEAFETCKKSISHENCLIPFDPNKPVKLDCDASSKGVGAVLSHVMPNGQERPIAFASRTLTVAERGYSQLDKEALSLIFGVKKFHMYLYGKHFTMVTDHKPLLSILGPKSGIPTLAAARLQRWSIILSAYDYGIEYRQSQAHANADALSRLPDLVAQQETEQETTVHCLSYCNQLPITSQEIMKAMRADPLLGRVYNYTLNGWPNQIDEEGLKPYFRRRNELSTDSGCLLWGNRVIIPPPYREQLLGELHEEHHGVVRMKSLARCYLWWPGLDAAVEDLVSSCDVCQTVRHLPPEAPLLSWTWPTRPWERIHVDYAEKNGQSFFIIIDAHSKWIEAFHTSSTTTTRTIEMLRSCFARYGLPKQLVSDNGPQFSSHEFKNFMQGNGIQHKLVPPYHPSSNGAAERAVQVVKSSLTKQVIENKKGTLNQRLSNFLLMYRITPHSTTGRSPAELFMKRDLRTRFTLLRPDLTAMVKEKQELQKRYHDTAGTKERTFSVNDSVRVRNTTKGKELWLRGQVTKVCGPRTYIVQVGPSKRFVHVDHIIKASTLPDESDQVQLPPQVEPPRPSVARGEFCQPDEPEGNATDVQIQPRDKARHSPEAGHVPTTSADESCSQAATEAQPVSVPHRYPTRIRKPPQRLDL